MTMTTSTGSTISVVGRRLAAMISGVVGWCAIEQEVERRD